MDEKTLGENVLGASLFKMHELKGQSVKGDYKERLLTYYLQSSPYASWQHIVGGLLCWEEDTALHEVKQFIRPEKGKYNGSTPI